MMIWLNAEAAMATQSSTTHQRKAFRYERTEEQERKFLRKVRQGRYPELWRSTLPSLERHVPRTQAAKNGAVKDRTHQWLRTGALLDDAFDNE
jgi:hypothetical protein